MAPDSLHGLIERVGSQENQCALGISSCRDVHFGRLLLVTICLSEDHLKTAHRAKNQILVFFQRVVTACHGDVGGAALVTLKPFRR